MIATMMRLLALTICVLVHSVAVARDDGRYANSDPQIKDWIRGLTNSKGEGCCDTADGFPAEVQYDTARGRYRVRIEGVWYVVPDHAVITVPNKLGYPVVWYTYLDGSPKINCFIPGGGA